MSRKGIIFAVIIFIALGLYVFLVEKKRPLSEGKEAMLKFDKDKARGLILSQDEGAVALSRDKDGKWQIASPIVTKADDDVVSALIETLSNLEAAQSLEADPSEWENFGLKKPQCEVKVLLDNVEQKLSFGSENPVGTSVYTRMSGKDKIFLLPKYIADDFKKGIFELREKRLLIFDKEKVSALKLIYAEREIYLEKQGEEWQLIAPVKDKGDRYEIEELISGLHNLKASGFIDEAEKNADYGLDRPEAKCIVWTGPEKLAQTVIFGKVFKEAEKELQYAQRELLSTVFKVEKDKANELNKGVFDLRDKIIFDVEREKVERLELIYPDKKLVCEKDKEGKWFLLEGPRVELDVDKINDMLWELSDIKAKGVAAEEIKDLSQYGLDKPQVKVIVRGAGIENTILFGNEAPEMEDAVYAQVPGNPRLYLVPRDIPSSFKKDSTELKKKEEGKED